MNEQDNSGPIFIVKKNVDKVSFNVIYLNSAGSVSGWYWFNKEPYSYTNWQPDEPSTQGSCAVASLAADTSQWMVEDCERYHGIGCKLPKSEIRFLDFNNDTKLFFKHCQEN